MKIYATLGIAALLVVAYTYVQNIGYQKAEAKHILEAAKHQKEVKEKEIALRKSAEQRHLETESKLAKLDNDYNEEQARLMSVIAKEKAEHNQTKEELENEKNNNLCKIGCVLRER